jgi:hypothetical protein
MRKHRILESMLEFALLASVVGFGLGVLAVFFAASQIFEIHPRSAKSSASAVVANGGSAQAVPDRQESASRETPVPAHPPVAASGQWALVFVGVVAGLGVFVLGLLAWLQVRSVLVLPATVPAVATAAATEVPQPTPPAPVPAPTPVAPALASQPRPAYESNGAPTAELLQRLVSSVEQLEGRLRRLEHVPYVPPAPEPHIPSSRVEPPASRVEPPAPRVEASISHTEAPAPVPRPPQPVSLPNAPAVDENEAAKLKLGRAMRTRRLLTHGEELLKAENARKALDCFEEALALEPASVEALIKKGNALERLGRLEEALATYDQAIALDGTATMAYLFKGGLCNRLERYEEAMQCYQRAVTATPDHPAV